MERFSFGDDVAFVPRGDLLDGVSMAPLTQPSEEGALVKAAIFRFDVEYHRIRIGGQRTLWGSCSPGGTLSFNWRLVLTPPEVLDYVVVHELCHLRVPIHSQRFWALVERHRAHWRQQRDWLRDNGSELLVFRPQD